MSEEPELRSRSLQQRPARPLTRRELRERADRRGRPRLRRLRERADPNDPLDGSGRPRRFGGLRSAPGRGSRRPLAGSGVVGSRRSAGLRLVAALHTVQWRRSPRHRIAFAAGVGSVYAVVGLGWAATGGAGGVLLGLATFAALVATLVAAPALGAAALGELRDRKVLPALQLTRLTGADLVGGSWAAAAGAPLLGLAAAAPAVAAAAAVDGAGLVAPLCGLIVLATLAVAGAAAGVLAGAFTRRAATALAVSAGLVAAMGVGTLIAYALLTAATPQTVRLPVRVAAVTLTGAADASARGAADAQGCVVVERDVTRYRGDRFWPLLAANPFVMVTDALGTSGVAGRSGVLTTLSDTIRSVSLPPGDAIVEECPGRPAAAPAARSGMPVWPFGVAGALGVSALGLWWSARRLRTPTDRVGRPPRGRARRDERATSGVTP